MKPDWYSVEEPLPCSWCERPVTFSIIRDGEVDIRVCAEHMAQVVTTVLGDPPTKGDE